MARATRYLIHIVRNDGSTENIQANSRRKDAIQRAAFIADDLKGWPSVCECYVQDTMPEMIKGKFRNIIFTRSRSNEA